jgi:hypothetical protein
MVAMSDDLVRRQNAIRRKRLEVAAADRMLQS